MKYIILFILLFSHSLHAMTIECLVRSEPEERIYLDINSKTKVVEKIYFNKRNVDGFFAHFEKQGWNVSETLIGKIRDETTRMIQLGIDFDVDKFILSIESYKIPTELKAEWIDLKSYMLEYQSRSNKPRFANLIINKRDGNMFVYFYDNQTNLGQCFFKGENDFNYILS